MWGDTREEESAERLSLEQINELLKNPTSNDNLEDTEENEQLANRNIAGFIDPAKLLHNLRRALRDEVKKAAPDVVNTENAPLKICCDYFEGRYRRNEIPNPAPGIESLARQMEGFFLDDSLAGHRLAGHLFALVYAAHSAAEQIRSMPEESTPKEYLEKAYDVLSLISAPVSEYAVLEIGEAYPLAVLFQKYFLDCNNANSLSNDANSLRCRRAAVIVPILSVDMEGDGGDLHKLSLYPLYPDNDFPRPTNKNWPDLKIGESLLLPHPINALMPVDSKFLNELRRQWKQAGSPPVCWRLEKQTGRTREAEEQSGDSHGLSSRIGFELLKRGLPYDRESVYIGSIGDDDSLVSGAENSQNVKQKLTGLVKWNRPRRNSPPGELPIIRRVIVEKALENPLKEDGGAFSDMEIIGVGTVKDAIREAEKLDQALKTYLKKIEELPDSCQPNYLQGKKDANEVKLSKVYVSPHLYEKDKQESLPWEDICRQHGISLPVSPPTTDNSDAESSGTVRKDPILIQSRPGAGKTVLVRMKASELARQATETATARETAPNGDKAAQSRYPWSEECLLPIMLTMSDPYACEDMGKAIRYRVRRLLETDEADLVAAYLARQIADPDCGHTIVLMLDAFDEIQRVSSEGMDSVRRQLKGWECQVIVTARRSEDSSIIQDQSRTLPIARNQSRQLELNGFTEKQREKYIGDWFETAFPQGKEQIRKQLQGRLKILLLHNEALGNLTRETPLVLTLACVVASSARNTITEDWRCADLYNAILRRLLNSDTIVRTGQNAGSNDNQTIGTPSGSRVAIDSYLTLRFAEHLAHALFEEVGIIRSSFSIENIVGAFGRITSSITHRLEGKRAPNAPIYTLSDCHDQFERLRLAGILHPTDPPRTSGSNQDMSGGDEIFGYEFMHATFGEYLIASHFNERMRPEFKDEITAPGNSYTKLFNIEIRKLLCLQDEEEEQPNQGANTGQSTKEASLRDPSAQQIITFLGGCLKDATPLMQFLADQNRWVLIFRVLEEMGSTKKKDEIHEKFVTTFFDYMYGRSVTPSTGSTPPALDQERQQILNDISDIPSITKSLTSFLRVHHKKMVRYQNSEAYCEKCLWLLRDLKISQPQQPAKPPLEAALVRKDQGDDPHLAREMLVCLGKILMQPNQLNLRNRLRTGIDDLLRNQPRHYLYLQDSTTAEFHQNLFAFLKEQFSGNERETVRDEALALRQILNTFDTKHYRPQEVQAALNDACTAYGILSDSGRESEDAG